MVVLYQTRAGFARADSAEKGNLIGRRRRGFRWEDIKPVLDRLRGEALWEE